MGKRAKIDLRPPSAPAPTVAPKRPGNAKWHRLADGPTKAPIGRGSREGTKLLGAHVPVATWERFAIAAVRLKRSQQALLEEAIEDVLAKHGA